MAEDENGQDKTEEATPERRDEFREKGQVVSSKEITSVLVLVASIIFLTKFFPMLLTGMQEILSNYFQKIASFRIDQGNILDLMQTTWIDTLWLILPIFIVCAAVGSFSTLLQTQFNFAWSKLKPDFSKLNPIQGVARIFSFGSVVELLKSVGKMAAVGIVSYLIIFGELQSAPGLMHLPIKAAWAHWGLITTQLFWSVAGLMLIVGGFDYFYNFMSVEKKMKMTKQEVKEEYKRREVDQHVKARMRRMQRDMSVQKVVASTKTATVLITNPTHFSIAIKYELGMGAPVVVAKGVDYLALRMREIAKENDILIVENVPLARTLYRLCEMGDEIPESLYKAVSEIIRFVFNIKGIKVGKRTT